jgi:hypothetical protein
MKKYILISMIALLIACDNGDNTEATPLMGPYAYNTADLYISFGITSESIINGRVVHDNIPEAEQMNNTITGTGRTATGFESIEITSTGSVDYSVRLVGVVLQGGLRVATMEIDMPGEDPKVLENQVIQKQ